MNRVTSIAIVGLLFGLSGCKENLSAPPTGNGPDNAGPSMLHFPAKDTLADSTGTLLVRVQALDPSGIKSVDFFVLPAKSTYPTQVPLDTAFDAFYTIALNNYKHGTLRFYAVSRDILDHETVTDTVTVTVK